MEFWTANVNGSWSSARSFIKDDVEAARETQLQIVGVQETGLLEESWNAEAAASLNKEGMRAFMAPAVRTEAGGKSAGVAILVPTCVGVRKLEGQKSWDISPQGCGGRLVLTTVQTKGLGWLLAFAAYFCCNEALDSPRNSALCEAITEWVAKSGLPFVILADWQNTPEQLERTPWLKAWRAKTKATEEGTCKNFITGAKRVIDYVVLDSRLAGAAPGGEISELGAVPPHACEVSGAGRLGQL